MIVVLLLSSSCHCCFSLICLEAEFMLSLFTSGLEENSRFRHSDDYYHEHQHPEARPRD